ncbi:hypothetical protein PIB30_025264 [Stylosanthes scabra]|uniref:Uncharacterized protein n=1 Tax=Stylosanthes scabra TaxID=79078 RepID=A0ABU6TBV0_9FABA|nr:hypothetical protein [Stylosanthes scabra]
MLVSILELEKIMRKSSMLYLWKPTYNMKHSGTSNAYWSFRDQSHVILGVTQSFFLRLIVEPLPVSSPCPSKGGPASKDPASPYLLISSDSSPRVPCSSSPMAPTSSETGMSRCGWENVGRISAGRATNSRSESSLSYGRYRLLRACPHPPINVLT